MKHSRIIVKGEISIEDKRLDEYLSGLNTGNDDKRKHKKAIKEFLALLMERGKNTPDESDYADFQELLTGNNSEATAKDRVKRVRKYFMWLAKSSDEMPVAKNSESMKREKRTQRFSLMLSPSLHERLELLAQFRRCSVTELIITVCEECVKMNVEDIDFMRKINIDIDQRKVQRKRDCKNFCV